VLGRYKIGARERGLPWELTEDDFKRLTSSPCFFTGRLPSTVSTAGSGEIYVYNGIDRLDNTKGYTLDNCVPCCHEINMLKKDWTYDKFLELCQEVATHNSLEVVT
jgi:hypothetical protein